MTGQYCGFRTAHCKERQSAVLVMCAGFLLPSRRCLTHTYDEDISWYGAHVQASKNLTRCLSSILNIILRFDTFCLPAPRQRQWLESFPAQTQYSDWRRLRKSLKKLAS